MTGRKFIPLFCLLFLLQPRFIQGEIVNHGKYSIHRVIYIDGDSGFTPSNGVVGGDGTASNPYRISNWIITPLVGSGICIRNTTSYFIVENCYILGDRRVYGIHLDNVTNGRIVNCTCINCGFGVLLTSSSNNIVENCRCTYCSYGVSINGCPYGYEASSNHNIIRYCVVSNCWRGIYFCCLPSSYDNLIYKCMIYNNNLGIVLDHCVHYVLITHCNISNNEIGINIVYDSSDNYITGNIFKGNREHARDNCRNHWDNGETLGGNYWEGHNASLPYRIPGFGGDIDQHPLSTMRLPKPFVSFFLYEPSIVFVGEEILFDTSPSFSVEENVSYRWFSMMEQQVMEKKPLMYTSMKEYIMLHLLWRMIQ